MRVLITGGAGFVGHHIVEHILKNTDWEIKVLDKLSYSSGGLDRLNAICEESPEFELSSEFNQRVKVYTADLCLPVPEGLEKEIGEVDYILHLGAESHVDNSIRDPEPFVRSNVLGTMHILNFARKQKNLKCFLYFSTDEVFGPAPEGVLYKEWDRYNSGNPYAATKAGGEELALAYANTYKLPVIITHSMNIFGERQHPEKFIPKVIRAVMRGEKVSIHANKEKTKAGSRFWIHGRNVADAILFILGKVQLAGFAEKFNIVGEKEVNNLEMAEMIAKVVGKPLEYELVDFHSSRPGHDLRYGLDGSVLKSLGWSSPKGFEESLEKTILWTINNEAWLNF